MKYGSQRLKLTAPLQLDVKVQVLRRCNHAPTAQNIHRRQPQPMTRWETVNATREVREVEGPVASARPGRTAPVLTTRHAPAVQITRVRRHREAFPRMSVCVMLGPLGPQDPVASARPARTALEVPIRPAQAVQVSVHRLMHRRIPLPVSVMPATRFQTNCVWHAH